MKQPAWVGAGFFALATALVGCGKPDELAPPASIKPIGRDVLNPFAYPGARDVAMPTYAAALEDRVPADMLVVRAQPAVYRLLEYGDVELTLPTKITLQDAALDAEWKQKGGGDAAARARYVWARLAEDAEHLLTVSEQTNVRQETGVVMSSGTGFFVSREGIVVTNAHMVRDLVLGPVSDDPQVMRNVLGAEAQGWIEQLRKKIGGDASAEDAPKVAVSLLLWLRNHTQLQGKFTGAKLVMQIVKKPVKLGELVHKSVAELLGRPAEPVTVPLTLLAKGEPIPGQDIAILKAGVGDWDPVDRTICLGLGDSDDVLPQARVQAMGFPSVAFDPQMMQPEAQYRVNAQEGQIANTVPMLGGWSAFEMTADINHGDSGGPVLDAKGRVIAINVGGSASRHTLAVPIALAKRMLKDLHVTPDPGPATALWIEAVAAYAKGEYDAAGLKIEAICELQAGDRDPQGHLSPLASGIKMMLSEKVNPYVAEMRGRIFGKTHK